MNSDKVTETFVEAEVTKLEKKDDNNVKSSLNTYGRDLVDQYGKLDLVIGHDEEIDRVVRILSKRKHNNPLLIGAPGVAKTVIVGLAQRFHMGDVPHMLRNVRLIELDTGLLIARAKQVVEFNKMMQAILNEVEVVEGKVIFFIDHIHLLLGAPARMNAAIMFKVMLDRGELRCIGSITHQEYLKHVKNDYIFERSIRQVYVNPSVLDTINIPWGLEEKYQGLHDVEVQDPAFLVSTRVSAKYINDHCLPGKAINLLDDTCANVRVQVDSQPKKDK